MKSSIVVLLCVVLLAGIVSAGLADATGPGLNGRSELMAAGALVKASAEGEDINVTLLGANYGKFVNANIEVQLAAIYARLSAGGSMSAWVLAPGVVYHFLPRNPSSTVPYVGAGLAYARIAGDGDSESSAKFQYFGGVKLFIGGDYTTANKTVFIEYRHTNVELFDTNVKLDMLWTGLSCLF